MTREEVIKILKEERWYMSRYSEEYKEAYDIAIEALQADAIEFDFNKHQPRVRNKVYDEHDSVKVVRCKDCRHAHFKDFDKYCPYMVGALKPNQFCSHGERADKVSCSKCMHRDTCEDAYQEHSQYCNGELAEQTEYKLPFEDEVMEKLDNLNLEFTIHGKGRIKRMKEEDND